MVSSNPLDYFLSNSTASCDISHPTGFHNNNTAVTNTVPNYP
jgi:hypothetical protein